MAEDLFGPMAISASGMSAQRKRMETIAKNIANAETTRSAEGGVYRRRRVVLSSSEETGGGSRTPGASRLPLARTSAMHIGGSGGPHPREAPPPLVEAEEIMDPDAGYRIIHDPEHPDADEEGYVRMPDVNAVTEMVDMMAATRAYEANLAAMRAYQSIVTKSLEI